ncbi:hypothetical protein NJ7G_3247 [Natrinema sp. J7-2]|nr:hypothetical protein NJ7G_3247 [Natrinema sp. J7-2]
MAEGRLKLTASGRPDRLACGTTTVCAVHIHRSSRGPNAGNGSCPSGCALDPEPER